MPKYVMWPLKICIFGFVMFFGPNYAFWATAACHGGPRREEVPPTTCLLQTRCKASVTSVLMPPWPRPALACSSTNNEQRISTFCRGKKSSFGERAGGWHFEKVLVCCSFIGLVKWALFKSHCKRTSSFGLSFLQCYKLARGGSFPSPSSQRVDQQLFFGRNHQPSALGSYNVINYP